MPLSHYRQRKRARHNRVPPIYSGRLSWRVRARRAWRRVWPSLACSDEEILVRMRLELEFAHVDWLRQPLETLRLLKPLPEVMLAADGKTRFRYFKVQKAACTSAVRMLLQSCGRRGELGVRGEKGERAYHARYIHADTATRIVAANGWGWYGTPFFMRYKPFAPKPRADIRFCVVRDPVERFQAAFDDIVLRRKRYPPTTLEAFLRRIEEGMEAAEQDRTEFRVGAWASDLHFRTQHFSLGEDASYFTHIFNLRQLGKLRDLLSDLAGAPITLEHANPRAPDEKREMTADQTRRVAKLYARDYEIFGNHF